MVRAILLAVFVFLLVVPTASSSSSYSPEVERKKAGAKVAICKVFGPYCAQALSVSWCESRHYVWARNGQYLGLFQMGSYARSRYGHHTTNAWIQSRAAYRYFVDSGRDWSPWSCKP
jgi:hypothetical protein